MYKQLFLGTKGLTIREVGDFRYIIEDVFGVCSLPYIAKNSTELISNSYKIARTIPLIYFVSNGIDFESQLCNWLIDVIKGHIEIGKTLLNLITNRREGNE